MSTKITIKVNCMDGNKRSLKDLTPTNTVLDLKKAVAMLYGESLETLRLISNTK